jgi:predicted nucleic acid-binding protein
MPATRIAHIATYRVRRNPAENAITRTSYASKKHALSRTHWIASLIVQDREVAAAALEIFRSRPALGFTDCVLLEVARKAGHLPLGTFDRNLSKIDGAEKL